jgi:hypothetical protein
MHVHPKQDHLPFLTTLSALLSKLIGTKYEVKQQLRKQLRYQVTRKTPNISQQKGGFARTWRQAICYSTN